MDLYNAEHFKNRIFKLLVMKKIDISPAGRGHFKISTTYYGKQISTITTNTEAIDRYRDYGPPKKDGFYKTRNQAANALHAEAIIPRERRTK